MTYIIIATVKHFTVEFLTVHVIHVPIYIQSIIDNANRTNKNHCNAYLINDFWNNSIN